MTTRVLFVCLGNICRSPAAEAVFLKLVDDAGLAHAFTVDSAGTGNWHEGEAADARMRQAGRRRGIAVTSIARQVTRDDFDRFDHILAMDASNLSHLQKLAPGNHRATLALFGDFDEEAPGEDVPDPYYGGPEGFDDVLDIVTRAGRGLLATLTREQE